MIFLRFILISIVRRSRLKTTFQSCVEIATMMSQKFLVFFSAMRCAIVFIAYFHLRRYALCSPSGIAICWSSHFAFCFRFQALSSSYAIATVAWLSRRDNRVCEGFLIQCHRHKHSQSLVRTVCFTPSLPLFSASIARLCLQIMHSHRRRHALCSPSTSCD